MPTNRAAMVAAVVLLTAAACSATGSAVPAPIPSGPSPVAPTGELTSPPTATPPATPTQTIAPPASPALPAPAPTVQESLVAAGSEPTIAISPQGELAVIVQDIVWPQGCSRPAVEFSPPGAMAWSLPSYPWGRWCEGIHAVVAWGPDDRLWAGDAMGVAGGVRMSVTYSDNDGRTWAAPSMEPFTPAWVGCFPAMAVDTDPASPNYGTLYVAYNWLPSPAGPGLHVLAKPLHGPWAQAEVPAVGLKDYPAYNRIGYRIVATPTGATVSFYEADLRSFPIDDILSNGPPSNVGREGFATAAIRFNGTTLTVRRPVWAADVTGSGTQWQSQLAVDDSSGGPRTWLALESGGRIMVGRQSVGDGWTWTSLGAGFKPVLAVSSGTDAGVVFVGWHVVHDGAIQNMWTVSYDHGRTWLTPRLVSDATWQFPNVVNGTGLREDATYGDRRFYWAWADTRSGSILTYVASVRP